MPYSPLLVKPMRDEMTGMGFQELMDAAAVDTFMDGHQGTSLLVVNSVCGCAAGMARPGVREALDQSTAKPDQLGTVFAGQDVDATAKARSYFATVPPSSPSMALFKDGELVYFLPRHRIEGRSANDVAGDLSAAFAEHCP